MRRRDLDVDRRGTGYIESVFAIMVISISLTLLLASCSVLRSNDTRTDLEQEARSLERQIMGVLSEDGITLEKGKLGRLSAIELELGSVIGMRAEICVLGDAEERFQILALGEVPESVDECYSISEPISFIEDWPEALAARLVVVIW